MIMKTLSIKQPWAWLIIHGGKNIENRTWSTKVRGRIAVHASKGMTRAEYREVDEYAFERGVFLPKYEDLLRGGVIGSVELFDIVTRDESEWFEGPYGFVLRNPRPETFVQIRGQLGFFDTIVVR
jgi:hypothetical protein